MTRNITASVLALSITLTSLGGAPAYAQKNKALNQFFAGAITALILNEVIQSANKTQRPRPTVPTVARPGSRPKPVRVPPRIRGVVPNECFFNIRRANGRRGVFGKICLNEEMRHASRLPKVCEDTIRVRYGLRSEVYDAKCLKRHGYLVEARLR